MNKRDVLQNMTDTDDYHFVFITESWLHDYIPSSLVFDCNKHNAFRHDRISSRGGGVCVLIHKGYKVMTVNVSEEDSNLSRDQTKRSDSTPLNCFVESDRRRDQLSMVN
jgi:hypothetical protein